MGLHHDDTDLAEWIARSNPSHPNYCITGYTASQGWPNITARAAEFIADPSAHIYTGLTSRDVTDYVRQGDTPMPNSSPTNYARPAVMAAFVALVTNNTSYATTVRNFFFDQMAEPKLDFSNTTHWNTSYANENGPFWGICEWLVRLLHAFDYIKGFLSAQDKSDIETWLYNAASFFHTDLWNRQMIYWASETDMANGNLVAGGWGNPDTIYTDGGTQVFTHRDASFNHINGLYIGNILFNNRQMSLAQFVGLAGVYFNETNWKNNAKYIIKNHLRFQLFPDGVNAEMLRTTTDSNTEQGWTYSAAINSYISMVADALYRVGDNEIFSFVTSEGVQGSIGGSKSLKLGQQGLYRFVNQTIASGGPAYADRSVTNDSTTLINGPTNTVRHTWCALANMYYKDSELELAYKMTDVGGYPSSPEQGNVSYMMQGALLPDVLFMYGDREYQIMQKAHNRRGLLI